MGVRGIERVTDIHHTEVIGWVKQAGLNLKDVPEVDEEPEITDLDERWQEELFSPPLSHELQTFVGNKRHKVWIWTAVNHWQPGIIARANVFRTSVTFQLLWVSVKCWQSFWYVTDGYAVYPKFIDGSTSARLHRKTLCYSMSVEMIECSIRLLLHYLRFKTVPLLA